MNFSLDLANTLGLLGVAFSLASFVMKRMVPLRALAMISNVFFIGYGLTTGVLPGLVLNCVLLPVNARRVWEIRKLSAEIARASSESPVSQWLLPLMRRRTMKAGEVVFRKGDAADTIIYVARGTLRLEGLDARVADGELVGEIGLFSPDKRRTQTLVCDTDVELYEMTDEMLFQLYYQQPKIGFFVIRRITERLSMDLRRQEAALAAATHRAGVVIEN
jgi:CRP/FNR family cyclic AMP-dependent transcriptional regulator